MRRRMRECMLCGLAATIVVGASLDPVAVGDQDGLPSVPGLVGDVLPEPLPVPTVPTLDVPSIPLPAEPPSQDLPELSASDPPVQPPSAPDPPVVSGGGTGSSEPPAGTEAASGGTAPTGENDAAGPGSRRGGQRAAGTTDERRTRAPVAQRQLRRVVVQTRACLARLGDRERRVLTLRAGLGPRPALSRVEVARRLELGVALTGRMEQRGLRRLGALDAAGACGDGTDVGSSPLALLAANDPSAALADGASRDEGARSGVAGVSASGGPSSSDDAALPPFGQGKDSTLLVLLGLLVALGLLVRRELSRR